MKNKKGRYSLIEMILFLILFIYTFRNVFIYYEVERLVYILSAFIVLLLFIRMLYKGKVRNQMIWEIIFIISGLAYLIIDILHYKISLIFFVYGAVYLYLIVWYLYYNTHSNQRISFFMDCYKKWYIRFAVINSLLAIYQYFIDPSILGLVTHRIYGNEILLNNPSVSRRATAFLGSPQNFSLFLGIALLLLLDMKYKVKYFKTQLLIIMTGGVLSGSRAFSIFLIILAGTYIWFVLKRNKFKKSLLKKIMILSVAGIFMTLPVIIYNFKSYDLVSSVDRMFDFNRWAALEVFISSFDKINIFSFLFGRGISYKVVNLVGSKLYLDYSYYESFLLSIYHRLGIIQTIIFLMIIIKKIYISYMEKQIYIFVILISFVLNILVTPSFAGLQISFLTWPIVLYPSVLISKKEVDII